MTTIFLIRHGENEYVKIGRLAGRLPNVHLNDKGRDQARTLAEKFTGASITAIYSSPLERTMETAKPIADVLGLEIIQNSGLVETDYGDWQDKKLKGLSRLKLWRKVQLSPSLMQFPAGEYFLETQMRIVQAILGLQMQHDPKAQLICLSHADPIKLAIAYFIGLPLDTFQRLQISPGSISILQMHEYACHLTAMNYDPAFILSN